ncbi:MAG: hypothetical protein BWX54_01692 [Verrucomicrobia bacterium ADurb.Bin018]|nr:MAG: hypothetical protein BWX54_01692 [Verrucomicrobia bacterium ADurb.Bin018]
MISTSNTVSGGPSTSASGVPGAQCAANSSSPVWSSESPSSSSAHNMPSLATPRTLRLAMVMPHGSAVPSGANGYLPPTAAFGAPHTTVVSAAAP